MADGLLLHGIPGDGMCRALVCLVAAALAVLYDRRRSGAAARCPPLSTAVPVASMLTLACALSVSAQAGVIGMSAELLAQANHRWGVGAASRLLDWQSHAVALGNAADTDLDKLAATNAWWNRVRYADDPGHWRQDDYWATPVEMLASDGGDCEDYVFGKYFTLRALGMPAGKLRMTYVRAAGIVQGHMVLAYYATPDADPLILDNTRDEILPASRRPDLQPVYSFNDEDLWAAGANTRVGVASQVRAWRQLTERIARERAL